MLLQLSNNILKYSHFRLSVSTKNNLYAEPAAGWESAVCPFQREPWVLLTKAQAAVKRD